MINVLRRFWLIAVVAITIGFMAFNWEALSPHFIVLKRLDWRWMFLVAVAQAAFWAINASAWRTVLRANGIHTVSTSAALVQLAMANVGKYLPGKIWGMVARGGLLGRHGVSAQRVLGVTVQEQYCLVLSAVVACLVFAPLVYSDAGKMLLGVIAFVGVALTLWIGWHAYVSFGKHAIGWIRRLRSVADDEPLSPGSIPQRAFVTIVVLYALGWVLNGIVLALIYTSAFPTLLDGQGFATVLVANTIGITIGFFAIFAPAGIGVREGLTAWVLSSYMPVADAVILTVLFRLWLLAVDALFVVIVVAAESHTFRRRP
jgi:uncharacterized membrane protein YbhN (UPF0104 family)